MSLEYALQGFTPTLRQTPTRTLCRLTNRTRQNDADCQANTVTVHQNDVSSTPGYPAIVSHRRINGAATKMRRPCRPLQWLQHLYGWRSSRNAEMAL